MTAFPSSPVRRFGRFLGASLFLAILGLFALVASLALSVQLDGVARATGLMLLALAAAAALGLRFRGRRWGWAALGIATLVGGLCYGTIRPRADRVWAPDVAHGVTADIDGDRVTLHNVRAFRWTSETDAKEDWQTRQYDLGQLQTLDMFTSVWDDPTIAHLLVSFGFATGDHVVFSVEIRKERGESFSTVGGFFRQFEQVLIAADEEDIVRLRTDQRKEQVSLYPVDVRPETMRKLFLGYANLGNDLAREPAFYNTITSNCTTAVFRMVRDFYPDAPLDRRLLKTGLLPDYLAELGLLKGRGATDAADISARALAAPAGADFSALIRQGG